MTDSANRLINHTYAWLTIIFFGVVSGLCIAPLPVEAGFGVSPSLIQEQHLVPGATLERTFYLIQGTPEVPLSVAFSVESEKAADWVTVLGTENGALTIPAGVQQFPVVVRIAVPNDAPEDIYRIFVRSNSVPATSGGQVTIALAAKMELELIVGDDVFEGFTIHDVRLLDIPVDGSPKVSARIQNIGNVPSGPDGATFELFNKFGDVRLAFAQIDGTIQEVPSFTEELVTFKFPLNIKIGLGEYWGTVKFYDGQKLVREEKSFFRVRDDLPPEDENTAIVENAASAQLSSLVLPEGFLRIVIGVGVGIIIIVCIMLVRSRLRTVFYKRK